MRHRNRRGEQSGYVALLFALLATVLFAMCALTVDLGRWYLTARQEQRAADAGALAGVPNLPGEQQRAFDKALDLTSANGFEDGEDTVNVTTAIDGQPTRLRVTISKTVENVFGRLLGIPETTITRTAVADYAGPVPMGSPCNAFGNDPEPEDKRSALCNDVAQFWANVGSPKAAKVSGDAYQNNTCASGVDGCTTSSGPNVDYDENGYFYAVNVTEPVQDLVIEAFDPALVHVGDLCDDNKLKHADGQPDPGNGGGVDVENPHAPAGEAATRYAFGKDSPYCTGDIRFDHNTGDVKTEFTVRDPGPNPWDPLTFPEHENCTTTFDGYDGVLKDVLHEPHVAYDDDIARTFRQWVPLCTIPHAEPGTYLIQVRTNVTGTTRGGHNRFALRAYSSDDPDAKDTISVSGYTKMAVYANLPSATTKFYLARVPSGAAGQILNVNLFDVGDATGQGTIKVVAPPDSGVTFSDCVGAGPVSGDLPSCSITARSSTHNGKWQRISVPIPEGYTCDDLDSTKCWVRLEYAYGSGNQPSDTTSWTASIEGDPVRLVE